MKLIFKTVKIHNFLSFGDEEFNFDELTGLTRVKGKNFDIPNQLNGSGKCLDPATQITIEADSDVIDKIEKYVSRLH